MNLFQFIAILKAEKRLPVPILRFSARMIEMTMPASTEAALRPNPDAVDARTERHNNSVIRELLHFQHSTGQGCFFVSVCILRHAYFPGQALPDAKSVLKRAGTEYAVFLKPDTLLVDHAKIAAALRQILPQWQLQLNRYRLNNKGNIFIGKEMLQRFGQPEVLIPNNNAVTAAGFKYRHAVLLNQASSNDTHFAAEDGSMQTREAMASYARTKPPHRPVAIFEIRPI